MDLYVQLIISCHEFRCPFDLHLPGFSFRAFGRGDSESTQHTTAGLDCSAHLCILSCSGKCSVLEIADVLYRLSLRGSG